MIQHKTLRFGLLIGALLAACGPVPTQAGPTATPVTPITRERAIAIASQECWGFHLALVGQPRNVVAQLTPLAGATPPLNTVVWRVQMEGSAQVVGGVLPTPGGHDPTPTPMTLAVVCNATLDANTGESLGLSESSR